MVVLHLGHVAHTQRVVPGVVVALPHQEQAILPRLEQGFRVQAGDLTVEPSASRRPVVEGEKGRKKHAFVSGN